MKLLLVTAAILASALAKPEQYKESEDFKFSRSSTDEGTKSGYYGAQRGNMGGNYEKAHNMDSLAQNQMSGLVKQVEGELGDGSNTRSGNVFTAANSHGLYGSGRYDLTNLQGRNFNEGTSYGDSQSQTSSSGHNSGYRGHTSSHSSGYSDSLSQNSRYQSTAEQSLHSNNQQALDELQAAVSSNYGRQAGYNTGYHSQSGHQGFYTNQRSDNYGENVKTRLVGASPARVVIRPGTTVIIPVAAQTYDASHGSHSAHDENAINTEAEVFNNHHQNTNYRPSSDAKSYESSYSYRKQWEKHDVVPSVVPLAIPTVNPLPPNSELYDDSRTSQVAGNHQHHQDYASSIKTGQSRRYQSEYDAQHNSALSSQSRYNSAYNSQHNAAANNANSDAFTHGAYNSDFAGDSNHLANTGSSPKSYQSSYSYHKSWERQGDPYVIYPATGSGSEASQRLIATSQNHGHSSQQYGSHYGHSHQGHSESNAEDCDENGHVRVPRSYNLEQQSQNLEDFGQQAQTSEDFVQQQQNLEELGQQSQNLRDFGNYEQNNEHLGQQTQNLRDFGNYEQNNKDLGHQTQQLNYFKPQKEKLEDFGDYRQNSEDLGQETQQFNNFNQNLEALGQQSHDLTQNTKNHWDYTQPRVDRLQQHQGQWDNLEDLGQQTQNENFHFQPLSNRDSRVNQPSITNSNSNKNYTTTTTITPTTINFEPVTHKHENPHSQNAGRGDISEAELDVEKDNAKEYRNLNEQLTNESNNKHSDVMSNDNKNIKDSSLNVNNIIYIEQKEHKQVNLSNSTSYASQVSEQEEQTSESQFDFSQQQSNLFEKDSDLEQQSQLSLWNHELQDLSHQQPHQEETFDHQTQTLTEQNLQTFTQQDERPEFLHQQNSNYQSRNRQQVQTSYQDSADLLEIEKQQFTKPELDLSAEKEKHNNQNYQADRSSTQNTGVFDQTQEKKILYLNNQEENLDQQTQILWGQNNEIHQPETIAFNSIQERSKPDTTHTETKEILTPVYVNGSNNVTEDQKYKDVQIFSSLQSTTVKPNFWYSVKDKFNSAKNKVSSWFNS